jgi:hypothetical protein
MTRRNRIAPRLYAKELCDGFESRLDFRWTRFPVGRRFDRSAHRSGKSLTKSRPYRLSRRIGASQTVMSIREVVICFAPLVKYVDRHRKTSLNPAGQIRCLFARALKRRPVTNARNRPLSSNSRVTPSGMISWPCGMVRNRAKSFSVVTSVRPSSFA